MDSSVERLHEVIDELATTDLPYGSAGEDLLALERARARLDAEVARRLREFDRSCEWAAGELTTRHVETIAQARRAARADDAFDAFEPALLRVARAGSPEDVANAVRQWRDALDADLDRDGANGESITERQWNRRSVDYAKSIDGIGLGRITLEPEGADIFKRALQRAYEQLRRADDPRAPTQLRADFQELVIDETGVPIRLGR